MLTIPQPVFAAATRRPGRRLTNGTTNEWRRGRAVDGPVSAAATRRRRRQPIRLARYDSRPRQHRSQSRQQRQRTSPRRRALGAKRRRSRPRHRQLARTRRRPPRRRTSASPAPSGNSGSRDVPRRIIDGIGGARIFHGETPSGDSGTRTRDSGSRDSGLARLRPQQRALAPSHSSARRLRRRIRSRRTSNARRLRRSRTTADRMSRTTTAAAHVEEGLGSRLRE